jgi:outer membrane protein insertion porin family
VIKTWILILVFIGSFANAAGWNVDISRIPRELQEAAKVSLGNLKLDQMSLSEVDDLIKIIHLSAQFDPVYAIDTGNQTIQIHIQTRSRIKSVLFEGTNGLNLSEIKRIVNVQPGDSFDPELLLRQATSLQDNLKSLGYADAVVEIEFPEAAPFLIDLKVIIKSGLATRIQEVELKGQNPELLMKLKRKMQKFKNEILTESSFKEIQEEVEVLLKKERAFQTRILPPELISNNALAEVKIRMILEQDSQFVFKISGSSQLSSLMSLDDTLDLSTVTLGNSNLVSDLTNRLRQYYLKKGYARVEIQPEQKPLSKGQILIHFKVKEGPIVKVQEIHFQGRISKESKYYKQILMEVADPLIQKGFYLKEDLDRALEKLKLELQNRGFLKAEVTSTRATYNEARDRLSLTINLDEGLLTVIEKVTFQEAVAFSQVDLNRIVELVPGEPLQLNKIENSILALKNHYKENGYLEMIILNERLGLVQYNEDNSRAELIFKIFEGPQVRVQSILIEGLKKTKTYVVRNELDFVEGEILNPRKIEESISRLQRTGHFSSVDIRTLEDKTQVRDRTIMIRVVEGNPGLANAGLGITNERNFTTRGYVGLAYRNILGTGRGASFRLDGNYNVSDLQYFENRATIGYLEPFLFDSRYKGRINVTRSNTVTDFERERATLTIQQTYSIEKDFTSHLTGVWDVYTKATSEDFQIKGPAEKETLDIGSTGFTLDADYRDNFVRPRKGHQSRISLEYGDPNYLGSTKTIEFFRAYASATHYTSFNNSPFTWSNGIRYGFLQNLSARDDGAVPYNKKGFYLGGPSTIRGFDPTSEAFPASELLKSVNDRMTRQSRMYLIRSTLSYPLFSIVEGTLFYDGGQIQVDSLDLGFGYRHAAGFGILINTPVGPLNLEFGFKLNQKANESPSAFHLSFGLF